MELIYQKQLFVKLSDWFESYRITLLNILRTPSIFSSPEHPLPRVLVANDPYSPSLKLRDHQGEAF